MLLFFYSLKRLGLLRVALEEEALGLDASVMGGQDSTIGGLDIGDTKVRHFISMGELEATLLS